MRTSRPSIPGRGDPRDFFDLYQLARNFDLANVQKLFFEKLKVLGVRFKEGRFQERLEGADMNQIGYLIPAEVKIDGEELVATLRGKLCVCFLRWLQSFWLHVNRR